MSTRRQVGDPFSRGRVLGLDGHFVLTPDLDGPGKISPHDAAARVITQLQAQAAGGHITVDAANMHAKAIRSLVRYLKARGVTVLDQVTANLIIDWINAPSAQGPVTRAAQVTRRGSARVFFMVAARIGVWDQNPAMPIHIGGKYARYVNAYTTDQINHLKSTAAYRERETQVPAAIALLLCGVTSGELASVRICDINLVRRQIDTPAGGSQFVRQRVLPIEDNWCWEALRNRITALRKAGAADTGWLIYEAGSGELSRRNSAVSNLMTAALRRAGLYEKGVSRVASVTEWVARDAFEATGELEYVANLLGMSSLDAAAHLVGYDWATTLVPPTAAAAAAWSKRGRVTR